MHFDERGHGRKSTRDRKLMYEFEKEMKFNIKQKGRKSDRDKGFVRLLKSSNSWLQVFQKQ